MLICRGSSEGFCSGPHLFCTYVDSRGSRRPLISHVCAKILDPGLVTCLPKARRVTMSKLSVLFTSAFMLMFSCTGIASAGEKDVVDTAVAAGNFKTLVAAVQATGLAQTLKGPGPFTVFAPTDAAFAKLPEGTVQNLLKPENKDKLVAILTYHVVSGNVVSSEAAKLNAAKTLN